MRTALVTIDSLTTPPKALKRIEDILYGTNLTGPRLPLPVEIFDIINDEIGASSGLRPDKDDPGTFLVQFDTVEEDLDDPGTFLILKPNLLFEDPKDPGTYLTGYVL